MRSPPGGPGPFPAGSADPRGASPPPAASGGQNGGGGRGEGRGGGKGRGPPRRGRASPPPLAAASAFLLPAVLSSSSSGGSSNNSSTAGGEERPAAACAVRAPSFRTSLGAGGGSAPPSSLLLLPSASSAPVPLLPPPRKAPDLLRVRARGRCPPRRGSFTAAAFRRTRPFAAGGCRHPPARFPRAPRGPSLEQAEAPGPPRSGEAAVRAQPGGRSGEAAPPVWLCLTGVALPWVCPPAIPRRGRWLRGFPSPPELKTAEALFFGRLVILISVPAEDLRERGLGRKRGGSVGARLVRCRGVSGRRGSGPSQR